MALFKNFPFYQQLDKMDCGPTCLRILSKYYGKNISIQYLRKLAETTRAGSSMLGLSDAAEKIGYRSLGVRVSYKKLVEEGLFPTICHWNKKHYTIIYNIKNDIVYISDPAIGLLKYKKEDFIHSWIGANANENTEEGLLLMLEPTPKFYDEEEEAKDKFKTVKGFASLFRYLKPYKRFLMQLIVGMAAGTLLSFVAPFLTQSVVDIGIQTKDINFIYLILVAQICMFIGQTIIDAVRGWILLHLSSRINIALVTDFFIKLMGLPIKYFDVKMTGDIMQRLNDNQRIQSFLTSTTLTILFSLINAVVFSIVLIFYNLNIFLILMVGNALYIGWVLIFMKRQRDLNYKMFSLSSRQQSRVTELIYGMQEIKLNNAERQKRWGWEFSQAAVFKVSIKGMILGQWQSIGSAFINQGKNIVISVISAGLVIKGDLTLGMMMAISYITGQLNGPIMGLVGFLQSAQSAKISLERISEIHDKEDEQPKNADLTSDIPVHKDIVIDEINFRYTGSKENVLEKLSLTIPANKVTAIVGTSGSGKTTLMKLLLKFYEPDTGEINIGGLNLKKVSPAAWRGITGSVMQEGFIFSDTIAENIAIGVDFIDREKLKQAAVMACIENFIEDQPLKYNMVIGSQGTGLSTGEKQRMLIARAIYKSPAIMLFDEATSSLDANNEKAIMENLNVFFKGRTAVVIAHRLSTVRNADQIVVLDKGRIAEIGTHESLIDKRGSYFKLVQNQLNLEKLNEKNDD
jgi:ATP-binding cassette, subfamily B, bacterial